MYYANVINCLGIFIPTWACGWYLSRTISWPPACPSSGRTTRTSTSVPTPVPASSSTTSGNLWIPRSSLRRSGPRRSSVPSSTSPTPTSLSTPHRCLLSQGTLQKASQVKVLKYMCGTFGPIWECGIWIITNERVQLQWYKVIQYKCMRKRQINAVYPFMCPYFINILYLLEIYKSSEWSVSCQCSPQIHYIIELIYFN